jgi:FixJ family two-component response regulator
VLGPLSRVYIIDDDAAVRDSLTLLLGLRGFETEPFESAEAFLAAYTPQHSGVIVVDLRMPGMSGLELQAELRARQIELPMIIITAHGEMSAVRTSLKSGAIDFLEKPIDSDQLLIAIREGLEREAERLRRTGSASEVARQLARLTPREREVLEGIVAGKHNREIASALKISARTVEAHKARVMAKMGVERIPDLIRVLMSASSQGR